MPREIDEKVIHLLINAEMGEELQELRKMLNLSEQICDLVGPENQKEADRLFDELMECFRAVIEAAAESKGTSGE